MMDFEQEVIQLSHNTPVLVDFWAPWCGPCRVIGPALEELEQEQGTWRLVKINVDENPEVSQKYGIRGIPDVRLFHNGAELARFTGAIPKHQIAKWLEEHIPDDRLGTLESLVSESTKQQDFDKLREFVRSNDDFKPGFMALAKLILWENPDESKMLVESITPTDKEHATAQSLRDMAELLTYEHQEDLNVNEALKQAKDFFASGDHEQGIDRLIQAVMMNKNYANDLPRRASIAFFQIMGDAHDLTRKYRRKFDMSLY